jgi:hypothetical protein
MSFFFLLSALPIFITAIVLTFLLNVISSSLIMFILLFSIIVAPKLFSIYLLKLEQLTTSIFGYALKIRKEAL